MIFTNEHSNLPEASFRITNQRSEESSVELAWLAS